MIPRQSESDQNKSNQTFAVLDVNERVEASGVEARVEVVPQPYDSIMGGKIVQELKVSSEQIERLDREDFLVKSTGKNFIETHKSDKNGVGGFFDSVYKVCVAAMKYIFSSKSTKTLRSGGSFGKWDCLQLNNSKLLKKVDHLEDQVKDLRDGGRGDIKTKAPTMDSLKHIKPIVALRNALKVKAGDCNNEDYCALIAITVDGIARNDKLSDDAKTFLEGVFLRHYGETAHTHIANSIAHDLDIAEVLVSEHPKETLKAMIAGIKNHITSTAAHLAEFTHKDEKDIETLILDALQKNDNFKNKVKVAMTLASDKANENLDTSKDGGIRKSFSKLEVILRGLGGANGFHSTGLFLGDRMRNKDITQADLHAMESLRYSNRAHRNPITGEKLAAFEAKTKEAIQMADSFIKAMFNHLGEKVNDTK